MCVSGDWLVSGPCHATAPVATSMATSVAASATKMNKPPASNCVRLAAPCGTPLRRTSVRNRSKPSGVCETAVQRKVGLVGFVALPHSTQYQLPCASVMPSKRKSASFET